MAFLRPVGFLHKKCSRCCPGCGEFVQPHIYGKVTGQRVHYTAVHPREERGRRQPANGAEAPGRASRPDRAALRDEAEARDVNNQKSNARDRSQSPLPRASSASAAAAAVAAAVAGDDAARAPSSSSPVAGGAAPAAPLSPAARSAGTPPPSPASGVGSASAHASLAAATPPPSPAIDAVAEPPAPPSPAMGAVHGPPPPLPMQEAAAAPAPVPAPASAHAPAAVPAVGRRRLSPRDRLLAQLAEAERDGPLSMEDEARIFMTSNPAWAWASPRPYDPECKIDKSREVRSLDVKETRLRLRVGQCVDVLVKEKGAGGRTRKVCYMARIVKLYGFTPYKAFEEAAVQWLKPDGSRQSDPAVQIEKVWAEQINEVLHG